MDDLLFILLASEGTTNIAPSAPTQLILTEGTV